MSLPGRADRRARAAPHPARGFWPSWAERQSCARGGAWGGRAQISEGGPHSEARRGLSLLIPSLLALSFHEQKNWLLAVSLASSLRELPKDFSLAFLHLWQLGSLPPPLVVQNTLHHQPHARQWAPLPARPPSAPQPGLTSIAVGDLLNMET